MSRRDTLQNIEHYSVVSGQLQAVTFPWFPSENTTRSEQFPNHGNVNEAPDVTFKVRASSSSVTEVQ